MAGIREIVLLGAGKLAHHLTMTFRENGLVIRQVWNRTASSGASLARLAGAEFVPDISSITTGADLYLLLVSDAAITEVAVQLPFRNKLLVHASGSVPLTALEPYSDQTGVFYPLQTFPGDSLVDFEKVPICIEASDQNLLTVLKKLAERISRLVYVLSSEQRQIAHMGAVFACNFTNFMYTVSKDLLSRHAVPSEILNPIILQTALNAGTGTPFRNQTGPALRGDWNVIDRHLDLLQEHSKYQEIYKLISEQIMLYQSKNGKL